MDDADSDLRCYQLARQLQLVPQLFSVMERNHFRYPMFYSVIDSRARRLAQEVLLCLRRVLEEKCPPPYWQSLPAMQEYSAAISTVSKQILSYLEFPEFSTDPPRSKTARPQPSLTPPPEEEKAPLSVQSTPTKVPQEEESSPVRLSTASLNMDTPGQPLRPREEIITIPCVSVRPPQQHSRTTYCLFVRMIHTERLNKESINPYFGRYGQTDCQTLQQVTLAEADLGPQTTRGLCQLYHNTPPELLFVQDFILTVDSYRNALNAVQRAYYKELLFIAFHHVEEKDNCFTLLDVEAMLAVCTTVFIADVRKAVPAKEIKGEKGKKRARSGSDGSSSSDDDSSTDSDEDDEGFVPDLLIDGFPYHIRENQIMLFASRCGTPVMIRMSVDDRSGAFTGAVLVRMSSLEETLKLSEKVHDSVFQGHKLVCGVLNQSMELVSLKDGDEVLVPAPQDFYADGGVRVLTHERLWV